MNCAWHAQDAVETPLPDTPAQSQAAGGAEPDEDPPLPLSRAALAGSGDAAPAVAAVLVQEEVVEEATVVQVRSPTKTLTP